MAVCSPRWEFLTSPPGGRISSQSIFKAVAPEVDRYPAAFERLLCAVDFYHDRVREIVIVGDPQKVATQKLLNEVFARYLPNKVVVVVANDSAASRLAARVPLLAGKTMMDGKPTAYVCEHYACKRPVTSAVDLGNQLDGLP